jgi:MFS transporter, MHS family, proline/betaine transporter
VRYSTVAFSYNLGNAIFGGTAPLIASLLAKKISMMAPGFYLLITSGLGLLAITFLPKQLIYGQTTKAAIITPTPTTC